MSTEPRQELTNKIKSLQDKMTALQKDARFSSHRDRIENLAATVGGLPQRIGDLRRRGYRFEKGMESNAQDLQKRWPDIHSSIRQKIELEERQLQVELRLVERQYDQVLTVGDDQSALPLITRAEQTAAALEDKTRAISLMITGTYDGFSKQVNELDGHLRQLGWMLDQFDGASFPLLPTEAAIAAVNAKWDKEGKDDPSGILYLTDQRLLYEQKQEITTKKVLFVVTEKRLVQRLLLELPLTQITAVRPSRRGFLGHEDHIDLDLSTEAQVPTAHFHLDGQDCIKWQGLITHARAGDFDQDRAVELDKEIVERVRNAPTRCPVCNAPLTQTIVRGMNSIRCEYCGEVIRL